MAVLPVPVVDAWGGAATAPLALLFAALALGSLSYAAAVARAQRATLRAVLAVLGVVLVALLAVPVLFSADVYAYLAYGERVLAGCDAWSATSTCAHGPLAALARIAWHHDPPRLVYGPAFVALAALVASLGALSPLATVMLWRVAMCAAFLLAIARVARLHGMTAAIVIGANPVALWSVAEGHNDALMLLAMTFALGSTRTAAIVAWSLAGAVKGIALVGALAAAARKRDAFAALIVTIVTIACYLPLLIAVQRASGAPPSSTVAYDLASLVPLPHLAAQALVAGVLAVLLVARRSGNDWIPSAVLIAWCLLPNAYPWYALWILPVAALFWGTPGTGALVVAALCASVRIVPDAALGNDPAFRSTIVFMQFAPPLTTAIAARFRPRASAAITAALALLVVAGCAKTEPTAQTAPSAQPPTATAPAQTAPPVTAPQFGYIVSPKTDPNAAPGAPRILEIALNAQTLTSPGPVTVRITTTPDVVSVIARALGREITIQQASPGIFSGGETIPRVPFFMRRSYDVEIVAATAAGKTATATVPVTLR